MFDMIKLLMLQLLLRNSLVRYMFIGNLAVVQTLMMVKVEVLVPLALEAVALGLAAVA